MGQHTFGRCSECGLKVSWRRSWRRAHGQTVRAGWRAVEPDGRPHVHGPALVARLARGEYGQDLDSGSPALTTRPAGQLALSW